MGNGLDHILFCDVGIGASGNNKMKEINLGVCALCTKKFQGKKTMFVPMNFTGRWDLYKVHTACEIKHKKKYSKMRIPRGAIHCGLHNKRFSDQESFAAHLLQEEHFEDVIITCQHCGEHIKFRVLTRISPYKKQCKKCKRYTKYQSNVGAMLYS